VQETRITVIGNLAADPVYRRIEGGRMVTNFRIGTTPRLRNREDGSWADGATSWWSVSCFGPLADNTARSLRKGERVVVTGSAWVDQWTTEEGGVARTGTTARITADTVGHDLAWGVSSFVRQARSGVLPLPERPEGASSDPLPPLTDPERDAIAAGYAGVDEDGVLTGTSRAPGDGDEEDEDAEEGARPVAVGA
jgi:single-strand DNA-binding protein